MHNVRCSLSGAAAAAALALASACSLAVEGDTEPTYGEVTLSVASYDDKDAELSRDERTGPGADLVAPLDRELYDPVTIDGAEVSDPSGLFAAGEARIGEVVLTREPGSVLRVTGDSLMAVRSAWRSGAALQVSVDGGGSRSRSRVSCPPPASTASSPPRWSG